MYGGSGPSIELGEEADTEDSAEYEDRVILDDPYYSEDSSARTASIATSTVRLVDQLSSHDESMRFIIRRHSGRTVTLLHHR